MNIRKLQIFALLILLISTSSCGVKSILRKADNKAELGEYYAASSIYRRAYRAAPAKNRELRGEIAFKMGNTYRLINHNQQAQNAYANAVRFNYRDKIVHLYYAEVLRKNGRCNEAVAQYQIFLRTNPDNVWAQNGIISCQSLKEWRQNPSRYNVKKADAMNSKRGSEFSPAFANKDGDVLYFNSTRENSAIGGKISPITGFRNNDFFMARKNAVGNWEAPVAVEGELNTILDEGAPSFTEDGKTMYFTRCPIGSNAQIFKSTRAGAQWSAAQKVEVLKDTTLMAAHPAISSDGKTLYFVSDMKGGYGGKDIWRVQQLDDDRWSAPENLGPDINTPGDEMFPYVRANGDLYFSSNGLPGFGGLDIFKATETEDNLWIVANLMEPINSQGDDFGITFAGKDDSGFFSSNRKETRGNDKLYSFGMRKIEYILSGKITDNRNDPLSDATIRLIGDDGTNTKIRPGKDGTFRHELKEGVQYIMLASARGFLNSKRDVSTVGLRDGKNFQMNFQLASVSRPVQVNNIFYEFGKWTLTPESEAGIRDLAKLLNDNPNITMEIGAHTDMVGSVEANNELSRRRAQEVVNYLIREGIDKERLTAVGYGKSVPVVVSKELAAQHSFLKEGDVLDEEFILSKSPQEQEIMNQINRRTEFKVLKTTFRMY